MVSRIIKHVTSKQEDSRIYLTHKPTDRKKERVSKSESENESARASACACACACERESERKREREGGRKRENFCTSSPILSFHFLPGAFTVSTACIRGRESRIKEQRGRN